MAKKRFSIIKFIKKLNNEIKVFPKYLTKFSQKTFTIGQIVIIRTLKEVLNTSYEGIIGFLEDFPIIGEIIKLKRNPHPTTVLKYSKRIGVRKIENLIHNISKAKNTLIAIDATGFENHHASRHYCRTIMMRFSRRKYVKLSVAIDTQTQLICTQKSRIAPANDTKDFIPLLKKIRGNKIKIVCADKGYDSKKNRRFVINKLKAVPIIPKRHYTNFYGYLRGKKKIDGKYYHQRSKAETVFSVMKKLFGSALKATKLITQRLEISYKCLAYNIRRDVMYLKTSKFGGCQ